MNIQVQRRPIYTKVQCVCKVVLSVNGVKILEVQLSGR